MTTLTPPPAPAPSASPNPPKPSKPSNKAAKAAFTIAIIALVLGSVWYFGFLSWLPAGVAVILAIVALTRPGLPKRLAVAGLIVGLIALVAGPATAVTHVVGAVSRSTGTDTASAPTDAPTQKVKAKAVAATPPSAAASITVPDVVGKEGDVAKATIKEANLLVDFDAGNDVVVLSSNWTVTGETPAPGTKVAADSTVTLKVVKTSTLPAGQGSTSTAPDAQNTAPAAPAVPAEYLAALASAQEYNAQQHMSRLGLFDQLTSEYGEQFSKAAGRYAVNHVGADWNANALATAKDYREQQHMSSAGIHDQLTSSYGEKFTEAQADYAIAHLND